jgi:hypothetical protein
MGDAEGRLWAVAVEPTEDPGRVRLAVVQVGRDDTGMY